MEFQIRRGAFAEWLQLLEAGEARHGENINPAVELIHHYQKTYGQGGAPGLAKTTLQNARRASETWKAVSCRYARDWLNRWERFSSARPGEAPSLPATS